MLVGYMCSIDTNCIFNNSYKDNINMKANKASEKIQKVKKVDLDKEFEKYCANLYLIDFENEPYAELFECAKYFFELGLNASNPLTWEDMKLIWNITDELDNMPEEEFYKEVLKRFKAQKGEQGYGDCII